MIYKFPNPFVPSVIMEVDTLRNEVWHILPDGHREPSQKPVTWWLENVLDPYLYIDEGL